MPKIVVKHGIAPQHGDVIIGNKKVVYYNAEHQTMSRKQHSILPPLAQYELVNRRPEFQYALDALRSGRSVLLHGMGGVGKTHLATHLAHKSTKFFKDGILWLSVGSSSLFAICDKIARRLDNETIPRLKPDEKQDAVRDLLSARQWLLVLDDFQSPDTINEVIKMCPTSTVLLVTARKNFAEISTRIHLAPLSRKDSIKLFGQRAGISELSHDTNQINTICSRWSDYPLGIVLSAGRVASEQISIDRLAEHLSEIEEMRQTNSQIPPELRQVSNLFSDHFRTLNKDQITILNLIAMTFAKSIGLILLAQAARLSETETEDIVGDLVKSSLVIVRENRYLVHDVTRDAILSRLSVRQLKEIRKRLAEAIFEILKERLRFDGEWCISNAEDVPVLKPEVENMVGAIKWALTENHRNLAVELYHLSDHALVTFGYFDEAIDVCAEVIRKTAKLAPNRAAEWKATTLAYIHWLRGQLTEARDLANSALTMSRNLRDPMRVAESKLMLADIYMYEGKLDQAKVLFEESMVTFRRRHHKMNLARALNDYADYWNDMLQDPHRALPLCQESFRLYTQMKDDEGITLSQMTMLDALIALGEYDASEKLLKDLRSLSERVGRPDMQPQIDWSEATMREGQGDYAIQQGKTKNGYRYYRVANSMAKRAKMLFSQFKFRSEVLEMDKILRRLERKSKSLNLEV